MSETNVVEMKPPAPVEAQPKRGPKIRLEAVEPTHIVDVFKLVIRSIREGGQEYPDNTEESDEKLRSHLFAYMQNQNFAGVIARVGKKSVGVVLGNLHTRPFGRPSRFAYVHCIWVDPAYRKCGTGKTLMTAFLDRFKKAGVFHWEALMSDALYSSLQRDTGVSFKRTQNVVAGRM